MTFQMDCVVAEVGADGKVRFVDVDHRESYRDLESPLAWVMARERWESMGAPGKVAVLMVPLEDMAGRSVFEVPDGGFHVHRWRPATEEEQAVHRAENGNDSALVAVDAFGES